MLDFILLALLCTAMVSAYPDGAPLSACDTMTPIHGSYVPQTDPGPYSITVSNTTVAVGIQVEVSISSIFGVTFQGFLLKALPVGVDTGAAGIFANFLPDNHYLSCASITQSAVTHSDPSNKTSITVGWHSITPGLYQFRATVAEIYQVSWVGLYSAVITVQ